MEDENYSREDELKSEIEYWKEGYEKEKSRREEVETELDNLKEDIKNLIK